MQPRDHFPILKEKTFLNSCSYGALSIEVRQAIENYLDSRQNSGTNWPLWCDEQDALRDEITELLGADSGEVAITPSVSAGASSLLSALPLDKGRNRLVMSELDFPATAHVLHAQEARGAEVLHLGQSEAPLTPEQLDQAIDERTALVTCSHVCYRNGIMQDVAALAEVARARGALFLLDAFQSVGAMPVRVKELGVDFLVGGCLKYLLGTSGVAFLYARAELIDQLRPLTSGWFAQRDVHAMKLAANDFAPDARRFEGGSPAVINIYAARAGLKLVRQFGEDRIRARVLQLAERLKQAVRDQGWVLATPTDPAQHGSLLAIRCKDAPQLVETLTEAGIVTSDRDNNLRVSLHVYNNEDDLDHLVSELRKSRHLLQTIDR